MNLSYSTDILQHSAWRVRTAEQLVLIRRPPARLETGNLWVDFQLASWFRLQPNHNPHFETGDSYLEQPRWEQVTAGGASSRKVGARDSGWGG